MSEESQKLTKQEKNVSWIEVSSSDEDEEKGLKAVQSPRVIRTDDYKNKRFIFSMGCVLILFIGYLFLMQWVFYVNDGGSEEISEYPESSDSSGYHSYSIEASARFMGHNHRIHRCDDRGFDCCYIYTEQHNYQFNPKYIVGEDEEGSNCPSLKAIVGRYNDYLKLYEMNANCTEVACCHVDNTQENKIRNHLDKVETLEIQSEVKPNNHLKSCPSISHLMYMETHHYPDPNQDLYILCGLGVLLCCWGMCSNSSKGHRSRGRGRK